MRRPSSERMALLRGREVLNLPLRLDEYDDLRVLLTGEENGA
jgi:hypothetical protein